MALSFLCQDNNLCILVQTNKSDPLMVTEFFTTKLLRSLEEKNVFLVSRKIKDGSIINIVIEQNLNNNALKNQRSELYKRLNTCELRSTTGKEGNTSFFSTFLTD